MESVYESYCAAADDDYNACCSDANATTPPPPQSARQALLEMFLGQGPDHLKRHLPEITKKAFAKIESGANPSFLTEVEGIGMQARAGGGNLQTMETSPSCERSTADA